MASGREHWNGAALTWARWLYADFMAGAQRGANQSGHGPRSPHEIGFACVTSHVWRKTVAALLDEAGLNVGEIADQLSTTRAVTEALDQAALTQQECRRRPRVDQADQESRMS